MAGPAYYPPANRTAQWFGGEYPGTAYSRVEKVVLHSTETTGWPGYREGATAPHLTVMGDFDKKRLIWRQHFSLLRNSRALRNEAGGVQTNLDGAVQVEIVGTCDRQYAQKPPHLRMWDLPEWALEGLADFLWWMHDEHGVPLAAPDKWPAYPSSPTLDRQVRMSGAEWNAFRGVCGHLHVPENTHLDPGDIPIKTILSIAKGDTVSKQDVLDAFGVNVAINKNGATPDKPTLSVIDHITMTDEKLDKVIGLIAGISEEVSAIRLQVSVLREEIETIDTGTIDQAISEGTTRLAARLQELEIRITNSVT